MCIAVENSCKVNLLSRNKLEILVCCLSILKLTYFDNFYSATTSCYDFCHLSVKISVLIFITNKRKNIIFHKISHTQIGETLSTDI